MCCPRVTSDKCCHLSPDPAIHAGNLSDAARPGQSPEPSPLQSEMVSSFSVHLTTPAYTGHSQQPFVEEFVLTQKFYARENCYQKGINFSSVMI